MDNVGPFLVLFANCCLMPLIAFGLGYAAASGWLRSPLAINRRSSPLDEDPYAD